MENQQVEELKQEEKQRELSASERYYRNHLDRMKKYNQKNRETINQKNRERYINIPKDSDKYKK